MTRKMIAAFVAIAALAATAPAFAKETVSHGGGYTQRTIEVSHAGYNLDTPQGADRFARVLDRAVKQACATGDRTLTGRRIQNACVADTMRTTVAQIDKPYLTAALGAETGGRFVLASN